jgi:hypothetical protein
MSTSGMLARRQPSSLERFARLQIDGELPPNPAYDSVAYLESVVLEHNQETPVMAFNKGGPGLEAVMNGNSEAYLWGYVRYEDVFGRRRIMRFGRWTRRQRLAEALGQKPSLYWSRYGGAAYNNDGPDNDPPEDVG